MLESVVLPLTKALLILVGAEVKLFVVVRSTLSVVKAVVL